MSASLQDSLGPYRWIKWDQFFFSSIWLNICYFFLLMIFSTSVFAINGSACLPSGFNSFGGFSPNVISLKSKISADVVLSMQTATDVMTNKTCTTNTNAELSFSFLVNDIFLDSDSAYAWSTSFNVLNNTPTAVRLGYELRSKTGDIFSLSGSAYSLYVDYYIDVYCSGGLSVTLLSNGTEARIKGVNSAACNGNYTISYTVKIMQNSAGNLKSNYVNTTTRLGFRARTGLYSGTTQVGTLLTMIPSSDTTVFQSSISCTYSLSSSTVNLGKYSNVQLFQNIATQTSFNINATSCNNTHGLYVYWTFSAVDPNDSSILSNTSTSASVASNVGAQIVCNNAIMQNKTSFKLTTKLSSSNSFPCYAYLVKTPNVNTPYDISPGAFKTSATLNFQFD